MRLTKTAAQAALALAYLAEQPPGMILQARNVAAHLAIPTDSALKILQVLARQELIVSQLGRTGGYRLHREPEEITLAQIVEAIDGPITGSLRLERRESVATVVALLQAACDQAAVCLREELARTSVADLVRCNQRQAAAAPTAGL
jgi:Rrf2 family protein